MTAALSDLSLDGEANVQQRLIDLLTNLSMLKAISEVQLKVGVGSKSTEKGSLSDPMRSRQTPTHVRVIFAAAVMRIFERFTGRKATAWTSDTSAKGSTSGVTALSGAVGLIAVATKDLVDQGFATHQTLAGKLHSTRHSEDVLRKDAGKVLEYWKKGLRPEIELLNGMKGWKNITLNDGGSFPYFSD